ncbi:hypothetical protein METH_03880 [Leisingera methylohalidivorans DSM 14336]|uniref:Uncharacterized protein n=1 Tax=Leisingera methylohalidivorans DSM 14336 TaxID=999552 RepID=V9VY50_9RHOB|nr:hypothetical protein METH_03880 [Leisingera methylohalidivorans DSM 14336]
MGPEPRDRAFFHYGVKDFQMAKLQMHVQRITFLKIMEITFRFSFIARQRKIWPCTQAG